MRALITGVGRSGSQWTAWALREAAGIDARHESVSQVDDIGLWVEVNTHLWRSVDQPLNMVVVLLTRDGRDVARSGAHRAGLHSIDYHAHLWAHRNAHVMNHVSCRQWFLLEDLTTDWAEFEALARMLGGKPDNARWQEIKGERKNESRELTIPHWTEWPDRETEWFWDHARTQMKALGYA